MQRSRLSVPGPASAGPWSMKLVYLLYFFAASLYVTYLSLYLHVIHLTGAQIGLVASIIPLAGFVLQPVWGHLSDRYRLRKRLLTLSFLCTALIAPTVALAHSFGLLLLLVVAMAIAISPAIPLSDATTLEWLSRHGGSYGPVRIYGSLGFLLGSLIAGPILAGSHILELFPLYGFLLGLTFLASLTAPSQGTGVTTERHLNPGAVLRNRVMFLFLILVGIGYGTFAAYNTFFGLYLHNLGATTTFIGIAAALASASELPVMALSGKAIERFGVKPLLLVGLSAAAVRWVGYAFIHDYRLVLILQPLHGLSFAGFYVAGVTFMDREVPAQLRSTGQTLFFAATFGIGSVAGANLFGGLFDHLQAHGMFLAAGFVAALVVAGIALFIPNVRTTEEERAEERAAI